MADINTITLTGRLTKNVELKAFQNSNKAEFSLAVSRSVKNPDGSWADVTDFFDCDYWTKANGLSSYLSKGRQVAIVGELRQEKWTDKQSGQPRSKVVVHVNDLKLLAEPRGNAAPQNGNANYVVQPAPQAPAQPQYANPAPHAPAQPQYAQPAPQNQNYRQPAPQNQNYRQPAPPAYNAPQGNFAPQTTGGFEDNIPF